MTRLCTCIVVLLQQSYPLHTRQAHLMQTIAHGLLHQRCPLPTLQADWIHTIGQ